MEVPHLTAAAVVSARERMQSFIVCYSSRRFSVVLSATKIPWWISFVTLFMIFWGAIDSGHFSQPIEQSNPEAHHLIKMRSNQPAVKSRSPSFDQNEKPSA
mmetsp:Transcript_9326/g.17800  ORF Transcript_9326/g.17800 Transcript_9326/m.17800 type:complete len:101 (+) Transcript_9326:1357-1659(+)